MRRLTAITLGLLATFAVCRWGAWGVCAVDTGAIHQIGNGSAVCVDARGLLLTVRHVADAETVAVTINGRRETARRVWCSSYSDGPVAYRVNENNLPALALATQPPYIGECLRCWGFTRGVPGVSFVSGRLLGSQRLADRTPVAVIGASLPGGYSGGPVTDSNGRLVSLSLGEWDALNRGAGCDWGELWAAYNAGLQSFDVPSTSPPDSSTMPAVPPDDAAIPGTETGSDAPIWWTPAPVEEPARPSTPVRTTKPALLVFVGKWCGECEQFKADLHGGPAAHLQQLFEIEFIDVQDSPDMRDLYQIERVPTFVWNEGRKIGYNRREWWGLPDGSESSAPLADTNSPAEDAGNIGTAAPPDSAATPGTDIANTPGQSSGPTSASDDDRSTPIAPPGPVDFMSGGNNGSTGGGDWWSFLASKALRWGLTLAQPEIGIPAAMTPFVFAGIWWGLEKVRKHWKRRAAARAVPEVVDIPTLPHDYSACYAEHMESAGVNRVAAKQEFEAYVAAYRLLMIGDLLPNLTATDQETIFARVKRWAESKFREKHLFEPNLADNVNRAAFLASLYKRATHLLRDGEFGFDEQAETIAEAIETYVNTRVTNDALLPPVT